MKLDRTTYEAWLLDRIEGRLTPAQEHELDAFLAANPDLDVPTEELPSVPDETLPFDLKAELKKSFPPTGAIDGARLNDFLVALREGDLSDAQRKDLERYLYEHPEAARDAKLMDLSGVSGETVAFDEKGSIERHFPPQGGPDKHRLTDFLIAALENDLSPEQGAALESYLMAHPEAQRDARLVAASRVRPEPIVFRDKDRLKKKEGRVIVMWQRYAVAASIALLLGFVWWMNAGGDEQEQVADQEKPVQGGTSGTQDNATTRITPQEATPESVGQQSVQQATGTSEPSQERTRPEVQPQQAPKPMEGVVPNPEPVFAEEPEAPREEARPDPLLAQENLPENPQQVHAQEPAPAESSTTLIAATRPAEGGTPVGTVLANAVRDGVIDTDKRDAALDGDDALAMVNKGLGAITGGQGRMEMERKGTRDRWKLRLGRNIAISASTGR